MENNNSVCYVAEINEISEIPGADNIELLTVGGWNCISKKGEYAIGSRVVIATTDAVIPQELSDKMEVTSYLRKGQRVRTIKLRGVYSECLIIPTLFCKQQYLHEGRDKMEELGIFKFEPPIQSIQLSNGKKIRYQTNPNFPIYYKFPNSKNTPHMFDGSDEVEITRKLHGTNARYGIVKKTKISLFDRIKKFLYISDEWYEYEYVYGSHNVEKGSDSQGFYSTDVWENVAEKYQIRKNLWDFIKLRYTPKQIGSGLIIYGEIYGPGIQKNYDYNLKEIEFAGFNVEMDNSFNEPKLASNIFKHLSLKYVPVLYIGEYSKTIQDSFVNNNIEGTKIPHEGIVVKHINGDKRKIYKVINPDYLIYSEKKDVGDSH
jgi:RNA ligase (TIGR02306 family)